MNQSTIIQGQGAEIRQLKALIEKMKQEQAQGHFVEQITCSALQGLCTHAWITEPDGPEKAVELSNKITNIMLQKIMEAIKE